MANKVKMRNASHLQSVAVPENVKKEVYYEKIEVDLDDVPALASKNPGDVCLLLARGRMLTKGIREYGDEKGKQYARLEVREVAGIPSSYDSKKKDGGMNGVLAALEDYKVDAA